MAGDKFTLDCKFGACAKKYASLASFKATVTIISVLRTKTIPQKGRRESKLYIINHPPIQNPQNLKTEKALTPPDNPTGIQTQIK